MRDINTAVVDSLKGLTPTGRLEKRASASRKDLWLALQIDTKNLIAGQNFEIFSLWETNRSTRTIRQSAIFPAAMLHGRASDRHIIPLIGDESDPVA